MLTIAGGILLAFGVLSALSFVVVLALNMLSKAASVPAPEISPTPKSKYRYTSTPGGGWGAELND